MPADWIDALERQREEKDRYFRSDPHSPISPEERADFDGLAYFPPDPAYRFEVPLDGHEEHDAITVGTSTGGEQTYRRWGVFHLEIDGAPVDVQAYKSAPDAERLWVPFRDETSGEETYGAGRYIDLEADHHRTTDGAWLLDFNQAYNPTCAYSDRYECPLPPTENWLSVRIEAGEMAPH